MPMVRAMRMLNAIEAGTTTGAQLQTLLTDTGRLAELNVLLGMRGQARRMSASSTAMTAVSASSTAMTAVTASSTAMTAVTASSTAMTAVTASSTAMTSIWASNTASDAVMTSATARLAVYNADTALAALQATPTQVQRQIGTAGRTATNNDTWSGPINIIPNGTRLILLRRFYSAADGDCINWARGSSTSGIGQGPVAGSGGRTLYTGVAPLGCVSGAYTSTGAAPGNNDTGNFVCAANGLRRDSGLYTPGVLTVIYITV